MALTNVSSDPATMPGILSGRKTARKARHGPAPCTSAARSNSGSMRRMPAYKLRIMSGSITWIIPTATEKSVDSMLRAS